MANVITYEYFRGPLNLPQTTNAQGQALLTQFITQYEPEFLRKALGMDLAADLITNIASLDPKWVELRDGVAFINTRNRQDRWVGFSNADKISPIANYVYYQFVKDGITATAGLGEVVPKAENADRVYPQLKLQRAWNLMADMIRTLHEWLRMDPDTYPEFTTYPGCGLLKKQNQFGI